MRKLALFVEGQTELLFISKLLIELAGNKNIYIEKRVGFGGRSTSRRFKILNGKSTHNDEEFYVIIYNSCSDSKVASDIRDNIEKLHKKGFEKVLGLRDVYPKTDRIEIDKMLRYRMYGIPTRFIPCEIVFAIMEIEAWFIGERSHFVKIDPILTNDYIKDNLSIDLANINVTEIFHPAQTLHEIYRLARKSYKKSASEVERTINSLNFENLYLDLRNEISGLNRLLEEIDDYLAI